MRAIMTLSRKNVILMKKYMIPLLIYALVLPYVFISIVDNKTDLVYWLVAFIDFLIMLIVITNTIEVADDKNSKVLHLLCSAPYTRDEIVLSKYVFDYFIFILYWILIGAESIIMRNNFLHLSYFGVCSVFIITSIYRGTLIPIEIKFGYSKTKNIFTFVSFGFIFGVPILTKLFDLSNVGNSLEHFVFFRLDYIVQCVIITIFAIIINLVSYVISIRIFRKKDLN